MPVKLHDGKCEGRQKCAEVCPTNVLEYGDDGKVVIARPDDCIECGACVAACPVHALYL